MHFGETGQSLAYGESERTQYVVKRHDDINGVSARAWIPDRTGQHSMDRSALPK